MKLLTGSSVGWFAGLPGHELGAGLGHPNWGWSSSAVSSTPSLGSEQPPCGAHHQYVQQRLRVAEAVSCAGDT